MTMPPAQGAYTCPYCRMASDGSERHLPALRRAGRRPAQGVGLRLDRAAADQGHGPHPVRPLHLPDQRHVRAGGRDGAARPGLGLLLPPPAAAHRPEHPPRQPAPEGRLEADAGRDAADHDDRAGARAHRVQRRRAGGDASPCRSPRAGPSTWSSTASSWPPGTSTTTGRTPTSGSPPRTATTTEWHYPLGQTMDQFAAAGGNGLLLLHAPGNTFIRDLAPRQRILVQPGGLIWKDTSVRMFLHFEYPHGPVLVQLRALPGQVDLADAGGPGPDSRRLGVRTARGLGFGAPHFRRHQPAVVTAFAALRRPSRRVPPAGPFAWPRPAGVPGRPQRFGDGRRRGRGRSRNRPMPGW